MSITAFKIHQRIRLCPSSSCCRRYLATESSGQYKKFLTIIKRQKEPPYLYTSNPNILQESVNLGLYKGLTNVIQKQQKALNLSLFSQLGVDQTNEQLLNQHGITEPLYVQQKSLPLLFARRSAIIESETGSGKTLTYLLPILQNLGTRSCSNVIVVPTRELASQVFNEILKYLPDRRLAVRYVSGVDENQERKIDTALRESSVVIGTPRRLLEIFETKSGYFRNVRRIVLDEVDKLLPIKSLDKIGLAKTKPADKLLAMLTFYNKRAQMIATSATVSHKLIQELQDRGFTKKCSVVKCSPDGYNHGKVPENIQHLFVVSEATTNPHGIMGNKIKMITQLFRQSKERSTLVFIPRECSVQNVADIFQEMGFAAVSLYKKVLLPSSNEFEKFLQAFQEGEIEIVVCTEETVRGMDFPFINRAFLTYIPSQPEDYVHVAGRVGRANRKGIVTTVLDGSNEQGERKRLKRRLSALKVKARKIVFQ